MERADEHQVISSHSQHATLQFRCLPCPPPLPLLCSTVLTQTAVRILLKVRPLSLQVSVAYKIYQPHQWPNIHRGLHRPRPPLCRAHAQALPSDAAGHARVRLSQLLRADACWMHQQVGPEFPGEAAHRPVPHHRPPATTTCGQLFLQQILVDGQGHLASVCT